MGKRGRGVGSDGWLGVVRARGEGVGGGSPGRCIISGVHHGSAGDTLSHKSGGAVISDADSILECYGQAPHYPTASLLTPVASLTPSLPPSLHRHHHHLSTLAFFHLYFLSSSFLHHFN